MANKRGLFNPSVPKKQLHPSFKLVQSSPRNKSTRRLMNDAFARFVEKDGNFVEQFQTTGFNTRTFELYVSELLHAEGFTFEGTEPQPDFCVSKNGVKVAIECNSALRHEIVSIHSPYDSRLSSPQRNVHRPSQLRRDGHYRYLRATIVIASIKLDKLSMNDTMHCTITTRRIFLLVTWTRSA